MLTRHAIGSGVTVGALLAATLAVTAGGAPAEADRVAAPAPAQAVRHASPTLPVPTTATVTAAELGADSVVAVVTRGSFENRGADGLGRSLEVITPDGVRHPVYSVDLEEGPADWFRGDFLLTDWRPELHTALLRVMRGLQTDLVVSYDVTTGAMQQVPAPRRAASLALAPDGSGVLMTTFATEGGPGRVALLGWDGTQTWLPARSDGPGITSTDGRTLVTTAGRQWWVTDLATRTSVAVDVRSSCVPHRWLDADSVVATCSRPRWSQLRRVDLDGTSGRLGVRHHAGSRAAGPRVFNDDDVRVVQGRSWYESFDGCGGGFLTRQTAAGKVRRVRVPGLRGPLTLVGTRGDDLVITHEKSQCDEPRQRPALTLFDPTTRAETVLTRLGRDEAWREALAATEVRGWTW